MLIGVPTEIKTDEARVGLIPSSVKEITNAGHQVLVQENCGLKIGYTNEDYIAAGATIADTIEDVYAQAEMIVKVKEPQPAEYGLLRENQILFTYLHLACDERQAQSLMASGAICIAYETITDNKGSLPLLTPMSQVAGRLSIQAACHCLEKPHGGPGLLMGGVPGVSPANVLVIGGGIVGINAIKMAIGLEASVTVVDKSVDRLRELKTQFGNSLNTLYASEHTIFETAKTSDVIIGAVLVPGATAPRLITREMLSHLKPNTVLVDVSIDQGGCFETSRPTSHSEPTYFVDNIMHYCVANMPGAVPKTSSQALNNVTLPYVLNLANLGYKAALESDPHLAAGLNVFKGQITHEAVSAGLNTSFTRATDALASA
jgi:alanine dehydrogenase